jgi:riboflavin biosynthesis pyrimidine reductase
MTEMATDTAAAAPRISIEPLLGDAAATTTDGPFRGGLLPEDLRQAYGGDLRIPLRTDRPTLIANFVSTIDGVVSFNVPGQAGGGEVSGFSKPDRFVMALLRSLSDAVLVGAGTLRDTPQHAWVPAHTYPRGAADFAAMRAQLGLSPQPTTVVVTASGEIDLAQRGLARADVPVTIVTTDRGLETLRRQSVDSPRVEMVSAGETRVEAAALLEILRDRGWQVVLCEGGPHLIGQLIEAKAVDELFQTISPQIAGRSADQPRLGLVEGVAFDLPAAPWSQLVDLRRSGSHLFARYRFQEASA